MWNRLFFCFIILFLVQEAASAQCPPPVGSCQACVAITSVTYLGKQSGFDEVKVLLTGVGSTLDYCVRSTGPVTVKVTVTRKNNHVDSGTVNTDLFNSHPVVTIPRGVLETDPVSYVVDVTMFEGEVRAAPSAVIASSGRILSQNRDQTLTCCPKVNTATIVNVLPPTQTGKDTVKVNWVQELGSPSKCLQITGTNVKVVTHHVDGSNVTDCSGSTFVTGSVVHEATVQAQCPVEVQFNPDVQSIEATIAPALAPGSLVVTATKSGNF